MSHSINTSWFEKHMDYCDDNLGGYCFNPWLTNGCPYQKYLAQEEKELTNDYVSNEGVSVSPPHLLFPN